jgi:hypothetical protein
MRLSLAITTLLSVASAAAGNEISPRKKSLSPYSNSLRLSKHPAADTHTPFNSTKKSSPSAVASELWADDRPSKSKSKPKPERLAGSIVNKNKKQVKKGNRADDRPSKSKSKPKPERLAGSIVNKKQVEKGNSSHHLFSRHLSSQCSDTPDWVDSYGDGCEWYETNDEPGCPGYGSDYDGDMGLPKDNCCHCQVAVTPYSIDDASDLG